MSDISEVVTVSFPRRLWRKMFNLYVYWIKVAPIGIVRMLRTAIASSDCVLGVFGGMFEVMPLALEKARGDIK